ncbi:MAG: glycosyltransferase family 4 protein, partial [Propionibacterium sp.]|nr:glycosyltransferase family 4 protein [Propionibacterium sp.]
MIAYICADPGIPVFGTKGASVHVQEIIRAWRALGEDVHIYCTRVGDDVPADLADVPVACFPVGKGTGATERERAAAREQEVLDATHQIAEAVLADGATAVYERFSLFSVVMAVVTATLDIPGYLEVNAPLIDEQREHRILVDEGAAKAALRAQLHAATRVSTVSQPVADWCLAQSGADGLAERIVVTPNGVNIDRIPAVTPSDDPLVLFVGTLKPWHGTEHLIHAAALSQNRWRLRIVGDGPQGPRLKEL